MTLTEKHILSAKESINAIFDNLLTAIQANAEFLDEMNATNDHEPQAEYGVSMLVEAPPSIPTDEDLANVQPINPAVEELKKRLDLEQTGEAKLIDDETWEKLVKTIVIAGWTNRKLLDSNWWKNSTFELTKGQAMALTNLEKIRSAMLAKDMDLNAAQAQNGLGIVEKSALAEFAENNKLK